MPAPSAPAPLAIDAAAVSAWHRIAPSSPAWLHGEVARRMADRLAIVRKQPQQVLDWWSGQGASIELLRAQYPQASIVAVEPTAARAASLSQARRAPWWSLARWSGAAAAVVDEAGLDPARPADLLWANMMLHWAVDPVEQMQRWQRALGADGFLMFSCFGPDTLRELRALYAERGWGPPNTAFTDMHDLGDMLVHAGFADPVMDMEYLTLSWESPAAMLGELRTLGRNAHPARYPGLRTPAWKAELLRALQAGSEERPAMRFEIIYGHAFKAPPRAKVGEETRVSLADMRSMVRSGKARD
ncbi:methyltransferase domain-containing protein [Caldimonas brevitalea]|uniref:Biotin synthase n=1 Tax=Caldimonas brevitalea TaxID=413882 RepID=A0A0G3BMQ2_9BURK|nr:methyltransferase domain-containing protein [Caldimonas brevitalea]AKJ27785.1 biotin synthase [Caldimonas brevitalea]